MEFEFRGEKYFCENKLFLWFYPGNLPWTFFICLSRGSYFQFPCFGRVVWVLELVVDSVDEFFCLPL